MDNALKQFQAIPAGKMAIFQKLETPGQEVMEAGGRFRYRVNDDCSISKIDDLTSLVINLHITKEEVIENLISNELIVNLLPEIERVVSEGLKNKGDSTPELKVALDYIALAFGSVIYHIETKGDPTVSNSNGGLKDILWNEYWNFLGEFYEDPRTTLDSPEIIYLKKRFVEFLKENWENCMKRVFKNTRLGNKTLRFEQAQQFHELFRGDPTF